jgi:hypothetical protein
MIKIDSIDVEGNDYEILSAGFQTLFVGSGVKGCRIRDVFLIVRKHPSQ